MQQLANALPQLDSESLWEVERIVRKYQTENMSIEFEDGNIIIFQRYLNSFRSFN